MFTKLSLRNDITDPYLGGDTSSFSVLNFTKILSNGVMYFERPILHLTVSKVLGFQSQSKACEKVPVNGGQSIIVFEN